MATHPTVESIDMDEIPAELAAELEREIARNQAAVRLVGEREQQAHMARDRAAESQRKMNQMMQRYDDMREKLEWTRMTLVATHSRIERHSEARQNRIEGAVAQLKERADTYAQRMQEKQERDSSSQGLDEGLSQAEAMLLAMAQGAMQDTTAQEKQHEEEEEEPRQKRNDYAQTVLDLQKKLSSKEAHVQEGDKQEEVEEAAAAEPASALPEGEESEPRGEKAKPATTTAAAAVEAERKPEVDVEEITVDLSETVTRIEAKCAGVREELGEMAMSEQYMRTKQAQLLAKRREKEAEEALAAALSKEKEALEMRKKVADMMRLLEERRNKLVVTENVLEKKTVVVEKVGKLLEGKERWANHKEKQRDELLALEVKPDEK